MPQRTNTLFLYKGATVNDPAGTLQLPGGFQFVRCHLGDATVDLGLNRTITGIS